MTAASFVRTLCAHPNHVYWPQDVVPSGEAAFNWDLVRGRNQFLKAEIFRLRCHDTSDVDPGTQRQA